MCKDQSALPEAAATEPLAIIVMINSNVQNVFSLKYVTF